MPISHTIPIERGAILEAPLDIAFNSISAESANRRIVRIQARDIQQNNLAVRTSLFFYLASSSLGLVSACGVSPTSGRLRVVTTGTVLPFGNLNSAAARRSRSGQFRTNTAGRVDIGIKTSRADTFYCVVVLPDGTLAISNSIAFA
jgi:hypothetical protein